MTISQEREEIKQRLKDKRHREAFVSATVDQTIPFQIRAMRLAKHRNWTQEELAKKAGVKQEWISKCENPSYGKFSLQTLKQFAAAFDVALVVRFVPFSELAEWEINMSSDSLEVPCYDQDPYFQETASTDTSMNQKEFTVVSTKSSESYLNIVKKRIEGPSMVSIAATRAVR